MNMQRVFKIRLSADDCDRLFMVARRRQVFPQDLLTTVVQTVLRDSLVDAVIDDDRPVAAG